MGTLDGRVVVITGAGRGIGAATAQIVAAEGASVVVNDLGVSMDGSGKSTGPAQELVDGIIAAGGQAVANTDDISDHLAAKNLIDQAISEFGRLDVLVNVAGILRDRMIFNLEPDDWQAVLNVHLNGTFNTSKHASAYWRGLRDENAHHRIINFTSGAGLFGSPGQPNYAAAKMGIVGLTLSCAQALRRYGVTSNAIAPLAATRMVGSIPEGTAPNSLNLDDLSPVHVGRVVASIASVESDWLNGRVIGSRGPRVTLYSNPTPQAQIETRGGWKVDDLSRELERAFGPLVAGGLLDPAT